jgi:hypothetical protein
MKLNLKLHDPLTRLGSIPIALGLIFLTHPAQAQSFRSTSIDGRYGSTTQFKQGQSRIVITVGESGGCHSGFGLDAAFGAQESWNSSSSEEFEFHQMGRLQGQSSTRSLSRQFGSTSSFQLGSTAEPDITGCVDESRNTVFINLRPKVIREQPIPQTIPQPIPQPIPQTIPQTIPQPEPSKPTTQTQQTQQTVYPVYPGSIYRIYRSPLPQPQPAPIR